MMHSPACKEDPKSSELTNKIFDGQKAIYSAPSFGAAIPDFPDNHAKNALKAISMSGLQLMGKAWVPKLPWE